MSTKAKPKTIPITEQQTPVIVKVGGDSADGAAPNHLVTIDSPIMNFRGMHSGSTWTRSVSTLKGRIQEFTIEIGNNPVDASISPNDQLASITIQCGSDQLVIRETGTPADNNVLLELVSTQVPFNVKRDSDWRNADALFFQAVTSVLFTQGSKVITQRHYGTPQDVTFNINFYRSQVQ